VEAGGRFQQAADAQLRQAELSRRDHVAELFNRAVGQLKDEKLEIRLGAILTLGQICMDFRDLSVPVLRLLSTYLKEEKGEGANLSYADCQNAIFRRVNFKNANLEGTNLKGADLSDARNLSREQLEKAITDKTTILPAYLRT
jgi:uncharacterized protein YjbI with pentapeptide repeats